MTHPPTARAAEPEPVPIGRLRSKVALLTRYKPGSAELKEARRLLAEAQIAAKIEEVVAAAPPLTKEQRSRLALLLAPSPPERSGEDAP